MAERPNPRSIAVIRRITGARDGNLPKLAIFRRSHRQGGARLLAAIAIRTGLAGRVARHSLGFGQSLWPLHPRRYMAGGGMSMVLRRRRRRQQPATTQLRYTWPRSRQSTLDAFDGHATGVPSFAEPSFDDAPSPLMTELDADRDAVEQFAEVFDDYEEAQTPAEALLSRHEAFLGLPLRTDRAATVGRPAPVRGVQTRAALSMPFVARRAGETPLASTEGAFESTTSSEGGTEPATASFTVGRVTGETLRSTGESHLWPSPSPVPGVAVLRTERNDAADFDGQRLLRTGGGLHAFRRVASFEPLQPAASSVSFATSVASRRVALGSGPTDQPSPAARFAPISLGLNRTSILARAMAQRAFGGISQQATPQLVWPAARPDVFASFGEVAPSLIAGTGQGQAGHLDDGSVAHRLDDVENLRTPQALARQFAGEYRPEWPLGVPHRAPFPLSSRSWFAGAEDSASEHESTGGGVLAGSQTSVMPRSRGISPVEPATERILAAARHHGAALTAPGLPWSRGRRSDRAGLAFPTGISLMQATATDLILRRAPGVSMRSFLGAEAVRILNWPAAPASAEHQTFPIGSPASTFGWTAEPGVVEPPVVGGPLPAPTGRVRRAMRVEPIRATLTAQYPAGALAAPHPGPVGASWPTQGAATSAARVAAMPTDHGVGVDTAPVPPELVPAFAARRAEHAKWGETLAVGGPPPLLAVEPSGASAFSVAQPIAGVLHRLAFANAWHRPADGRPHGTREQAATPGAALPLSLGGAGFGSSVRDRTGSRQAVAGGLLGASWPNTVGSTGMAAPVGNVPGPLASTGSTGGWDRADLSLPAIGRRFQDIFSGGGLPAMSGRPAIAARGILGVAGSGSVAAVPPVFAGGWPLAASEQMVLQRRTRTIGRGRPADGTGAGEFGVRSSVRLDQAGTAATSSVASATADTTPRSWATIPSLPVARPWRRSIATTPPMTAAVQAFARWPVFRSALADVAEPGAVQRSVAAEAMAASQGQALPPLVRRSMEHLFRMDLAQVRVHSGAQAARATGAVAARAMAHGTDIYMPGGVGDGPDGADMPLLAHELTHVAHHMGHRPPAATPSLTLARRSAPEEHDAERIERMVADAVQDQSPVQREPAAPLTLARRPAPVTIMRVEGDAPPATASAPTSSASSTTAEGGAKAQEKTEEKKKTDKLAEEIFRRLERRLIVARERGGHRW